MEIDIQTKTNNPLLKRTEVRFFLHHEGESTPKRELVRSELADKLKVKKENIMINFMKSNFGKSETIGYARIYKSVEEAKIRERKYILKRNNVIMPQKEKKKEEPEKPPEKPVAPEKATEDESKKPEESKEKTDEKVEDLPKTEETNKENIEQEKPKEEKTEKKD
jgi:small subunit ribosomal protein S24e